MATRRKPAGSEQATTSTPAGDGVGVDGITLRGRLVQFRRGIPGLDAEALKYGETHAKQGGYGILFFFPLVGLGVAHAVYRLGATALYDNQFALLKSCNCGWLYIIVALFNVLTSWLSTYPIYLKNKIFHSPGDMPALDIFELSNLRGPTQQVYKVLSSSANGLPTAEERTRGFVVPESEGLIGQYNRANRSMQHFAENSVGAGARLMCSAFAFPFPTLVTFGFFVCGRVMHQVGYADAKKGYTSLVRVVGMILFTMLLGELPQNGFVLYAGLKALDLL